VELRARFGVWRTLDNRAYLVLLALGALDAAGYSVIAPVLPSISRELAAGPALIGVLVASFPAAMVAGFAAAGQLVRRGRTTLVLRLSLLLTDGRVRFHLRLRLWGVSRVAGTDGAWLRWAVDRDHVRDALASSAT
jgi:MFS family permease